MWRALRNLALKIGDNEDFRELVRGVAMAFGWLIVSAIVVLIAHCKRPVLGVSQRMPDIKVEAESTAIAAFRVWPRRNSSEIP
jgi:hypothetical protein